MTDKYKLYQNDERNWIVFEVATEQVLTEGNERSGPATLYRALKKGYGFGSCGWTPRFILTQCKVQKK